ncbi:glycoside hydrolase family 16 protein [Obba rivulosa]|uniref:Glycoside hydrolase family 16 protein n=1 Tax=Obba rivulosa TaxID=1052685 RepID=A0A8E2AP46_9APHY|nr:glycoside hydrolase family 16 protein [Obba rivulosa]
MSRLSRYVLALCVLGSVAGFDIIRDYSGESFFDGWDFYGFRDNLTLGNVTWVDYDTALSQRLAYVNDAGNVILKVDNFTDVPFNSTRNSIRITTQDFYDFGSVWIIDAVHLPYGCSVWPAFWSKGPLWPNDGEIDIIEAINVMPNNQMALHTTQGCIHTTPPDQTGNSIFADCGIPAGCTVGESQPNSYESGFAAAGGGVWATQFDVSGIYIWFWSRPNIPPSITQANSTSSIDISTWGPPSASYPAGSNCNVTQFFTPQQLIFDITLCGDWAGVPSIYDSTCSGAGPTGNCYLDNVMGPGSPKYDNAYFEVSYVRTYTTGTSAPSSTSASVPSATTSGTVAANDPSGAQRLQISLAGTVLLISSWGIGLYLIAA